MEHWQQGSDLASVRDEAAWSKLPIEERPGWRQVGAEITNTLTRKRPEHPQPEKSAHK